MSYILIAIAAILNALMDILENENFRTSIFRNRNEKFWYKRESWKYARKILRWKLDAWHIAKSLMLLCIVLAIVFADHNNTITIWINGLFELKVYSALFNAFVFGTIWILSFNLFYNKVFRAK